MYVRFLGEKEIYKCNVVPISENVVSLQFENDVVVNTKGFHVFADEKCQYDIGGKTYEKFKTIYRNDEQTGNGYQMSNDGSQYIEDVSDNIELPISDGASDDLSVSIMDKKYELYRLKVELQSTDYIIIKAYEANLVGEVLTEYDFQEVHARRQEIRNQINVLESEIEALTAEREGNLNG